VPLAAIAWAAPAHAHLVETGFGDFYDGIAHVAMTPSDLLVLVAFALLAGQGGPRTARWTLLLLPLAWLIGGALGASRPMDIALPWLTTITFGIAGAVVALRLAWRAEAVAAFALAAGLLHGYANGATMAPGGANALMLAGAATAAFCALALISAQVTQWRAGWTSIAVRVGGSWLAAAALLMLGWLARPGG
jgi:hydrogenase/urease accessory protein HupE